MSHGLKWRKENKTYIPGKMRFRPRNFNLIDCEMKQISLKRTTATKKEK